MKSRSARRVLHAMLVVVASAAWLLLGIAVDLFDVVTRRYGC
jgi:uncharacterized membrane protein YuzA (DUF378 family)